MSCSELIKAEKPHTLHTNCSLSYLIYYQVGGVRQIKITYKHYYCSVVNDSTFCLLTMVLGVQAGQGESETQSIPDR